MSRSFVLSASALFAVALMLGACSKSATSGNASTPKSSMGNATPPGAPGAVMDPETTRKDALKALGAKADPAFPLTSYIPINSSHQLWFYDVALNGREKDDFIYKLLSEDYNETHDEFARHDIVQKLTPTINAGLADAKSHPYVVYDIDGPSIGPYDFSTHSFPLIDNNVLNGTAGISYDEMVSNKHSSSKWNGDVDLVISNPEDFKTLSVSDETSARSIEADRNNTIEFQNHYKLRVFAYILSPNNNAPKLHTIPVKALKVQILKEGKSIAELDAKS